MATRPALRLTATPPVELTATLALTAGAEYFVEAVDGPAELIETATATAPAAGVRGHILWPGSDGRPADARVVTPSSGAYLWARAFRARAVLVVTEA